MAKNKARQIGNHPKNIRSRPSPVLAAKFQCALAMHQQGQLDLAESLYREVLHVQPTHFDSLLFLGHLSLQTGHTHNAVDFLSDAISINKNHPAAHFNYGLALLKLLRYENAIASFGRAIELKPDYSEAYNNQGSALQNLGQHENAIASFDRAIEFQPENEFAHNNRGISLQKLGQHIDAIASFDQAILLNNSNGVAHNNRGISLLNLGRHEEAIVSFNRAIELTPDYFEAFINRGIALPTQERHEEALVSFDRAIVLRPGNGVAHNSRGMSLLHMGRYEEAIACFDRAIELVPNYFEAFNNRGFALPYVGRYEEALDSLDHAIDDQEEDSFDARNIRGNVLRDLKRHEEALESYRQALDLRPEDATAHYNESMCLLQMGNFSEGWKKLEWRWQTERYKKDKRDFPQPLWLGKQDLCGRTILLHAEQGLGDTIQFCRYSKLLAAQGATVILEVQPELKSMLINLAGVSQIIARGELLPDFDYHCPLLSLPLAFNTRLDSIPAEKCYLRSDPEYLNIWQAKLGRKTLPRIGLAWSGNRLFGNDHNRSIPLSNFVKLLSAHAQFICIQKDVRATDSPILDERKDIAQFGTDLHDFSDTAALVDLMDLVISVDTSVAHLAGALGKPVWLLLPFNPDWRWLLDRNDSPWYPSATLFRQSRSNDWNEVFERVLGKLASFSQCTAPFAM
ncbi:MAG: tetratricopeptide repeat protein [Sterolibacterium sp.]|nr:tetratricopeptide repeat protein [Sterolibacterium sp.]